jgi:hypothetical protein
MSDLKYKLENVHISTIKAGDTVMHEGYIRTICPSNINYGFHGTTLFGDSYRSGSVPVKKAIIYSPLED